MKSLPILSSVEHLLVSSILAYLSGHFNEQGTQIQCENSPGSESNRRAGGVWRNHETLRNKKPGAGLYSRYYCRVLHQSLIGLTFAFRMDVVGGEGGVRVALEELAAEQELHALLVRRELDLAHAHSSHAKIRWAQGHTVCQSAPSRRYVVPSQERAGRQMVLRLTTSCDMCIGSRGAGPCCVWPACLASVLTSLVWQTAASTWALSRRLFAVSHDWRAGPVNSGSVAQVRLFAAVLCADLWWTSLAVHHSCLLKNCRFVGAGSQAALQQAFTRTDSECVQCAGRRRETFGHCSRDWRVRLPARILTKWTLANVLWPGDDVVVFEFLGVAYQIRLIHSDHCFSTCASLSSVCCLCTLRHGFPVHVRTPDVLHEFSNLACVCSGSWAAHVCHQYLHP